MNTPKRRWFYSIIGVVILVLAIPLTVYLVQKQQEIRQRAQEGTVTPQTPASTITYPWQYPRSANNVLPVVSTATRSLVATIPFSARDCPKKSRGDADCNNMVDLSDVSYWQIDYEKNTTYYADFNGDGKVNLTDYNIWREHANIAAIPLVQKLSQKLGLEKLLAATVWKVMSKNTFTAFAQEAIPTVSDSTLVLSADIYRIINQYTDQSYSVQTNETGNIGGQMTYYNPNGDQIAQVNNYNQDTATLTTRVGNNVVSVAQNPDGLVGQTIQDANGAFKAAQFWPSTEAYARGDFPQAVTLPIAGGFSTVSLVPNVGAQVISRSANGSITSYSTISGPLVSITDYVNSSSSVSNGENNRTIYTIWNNLGGQTAYLFENLVVVSTIVTDSKQNTTIITPLGIGQYRMVTTNSKKETTEQTVADPMLTLGVDFPSPSVMTQQTQQYARTRTTAATSFTVGFAANGRMPVQISAVNRLLAIQNAQPAVLGAKTVKQGEKAVLGESMLLAAADHDAPGGRNAPDGPVGSVINNITNNFLNGIGIGDLQGPQTQVAPQVAPASGNPVSMPQGAMEFPVSGSIYAPGNTGSELPADTRDVDAGSREAIPAQGVGRSNGEAGDGAVDQTGPAAPANPGRSGSGDEGAVNSGSAPAEVPDGGPAAAAVAADVSDSIPANVVETSVASTPSDPLDLSDLGGVTEAACSSCNPLDLSDMGAVSADQLDMSQYDHGWADTPATGDTPGDTPGDGVPGEPGPGAGPSADPQTDAAPDQGSQTPDQTIDSGSYDNNNNDNQSNQSSNSD